MAEGSRGLLGPPGDTGWLWGSGQHWLEPCWGTVCSCTLRLRNRQGKGLRVGRTGQAGLELRAFRRPPQEAEWDGNRLLPPPPESCGQPPAAQRPSLCLPQPATRRWPWVLSFLGGGGPATASSPSQGRSQASTVEGGSGWMARAIPETPGGLQSAHISSPN